MLSKFAKFGYENVSFIHIGSALLYANLLCSIQILMSVSRIVSTTVMRMPTASIPLEVTTAAVVLAMRGMDSTVQVIQACVVHHFFSLDCSSSVMYSYMLIQSLQISMNVSWVLISV